jgi:hypothetical protein
VNALYVLDVPENRRVAEIATTTNQVASVGQIGPNVEIVFNGEIVTRPTTSPTSNN